MLDSLKTYLLYGNHFCGVEHTAHNGEEKLYATVLKKSKKELDIDSVFEASSMESLAPKLSKKQHVFLVINNDNVLTKRIESGPIDSDKLVYQAFPNINLDDFFYEVIVQGSSHFVSICRKTYVKDLIASYNAKGFCFINVTLGNMIASNIVGFVSSKTLLTSNSKITLENEFITSIEKANTDSLINYNINGLDVHNNHVLSLSAALDSVIHNYHSETNYDTLKGVLKRDYRQSRFFTQFLKTGLISLLGVLLINFFVFNHYFNGVNTLQQTSQINQTTKQNLLKLDEAVSKSQKMVDDMLKSSSSKSSLYANAIIQSLPNSILLSDLNYQPLKKNIKQDKAIELKYNTIIVSGESNSSESFSKWLVTLEAMDWLNKVEIINYEDTSKSVSNFSLKLNITYDD